MRGLGRIAGLCLALLLLWGVVAPAVEARPERKPDCEVKVINDSDFDIYIQIDGRNEGQVDKRSSETFSIYRWGELSVDATADHETASDSVTLSPTSERDEVTFKNDDFPDNTRRLEEAKKRAQEEE